jgi:hypothetical protein
MKFTEAFRKLGYSVEAQRQDWTAEKADGVCISLWQKEMGKRDGLQWMDTKVHATDNDGWRRKPGNRKRIRHLRRALDEFEGIVDVVIVQGFPGKGFGNAVPWLAADRHGTRWRVTYLEEETGHFEVVLERPELS